jgi:hypothetical protein
LRAALSSLDPGEVEPHDEENAAGSRLDDWGQGQATPRSLRIVDAHGLGLLVAAATWVADDTAQAQVLLNGITAALWPQAVLERLLQADFTRYEGAEFPAMQTLMSGPGRGLGLPSNWSPIVGGLGRGPGPMGPGMPGWPGGPKLPEKLPPIKVHPTIADLWPRFRWPGNGVPTQREFCILLIPLRLREARERAPNYEIQSISDTAACAGAVITLSGVNFGLLGFVLFPAKVPFANQPAVVEHWSETSIQVRVPSWASSGVIRLQIYVETIALCGMPFAIYRQGNSLPYFHGGSAVVHSFTLDSEPTQRVVEPGAEVMARFATSVGDGTLATFSVFDGSSRIVHVSGLEGGLHDVPFRVPSSETVLDLRAVVFAGNACGGSEASVRLLVAQQPKLNIVRFEVTQGIQRFDHSVRMAARRRTMVRVYLLPGLSKFSYVPGVANAVPGVTGTVTIWRGAQKLTVVPPVNAPFVARNFFFPYARDDVAGSLNFMLPSHLLTGALRLEIKAEVAGPLPLGLECPGGRCVSQRSVDVNFEAVHGISLVRVLINDASRGLPAPTLADFQSALLGAVSRFPVPDDGWQIRIAPGLQSITTNRNLATQEGWAEILEDLDDVAGDTDDAFDHRWVGLLPARQPGDMATIQGMALTHSIDRPWPLSNDYLTMAVIAGRPEVFAHELGHTFGLEHAGCPMAGQPGAPEDIDPGLPPRIEEAAIDLFTLATYKSDLAGDLMGYCSRDGLWPSIVTWHRLLDQLR